VLAHAAKAQTDAFAAVMRGAEAQKSLARDAFYIDLTASAMPHAALSRNLSGVPVLGGRWLASEQSGTVREPLFHAISVDAKGGYYVQSE
jgi:hypothetical protein